MDEDLNLGPEVTRELVLGQLGEWEGEIGRSPAGLRKAYFSLGPVLRDGLNEERAEESDDAPDGADLDNLRKLQVAGAFLAAWHSATGDEVAVHKTDARTIATVAMAGREPGAARMETLGMRDEILLHFEREGIPGKPMPRPVVWLSKLIGPWLRKV